MVRHGRDGFRFVAWDLHNSDLVKIKVYNARHHAIQRLIDLGLFSLENEDWIMLDEVYEQFLADCRNFYNNITLRGEDFLKNRNLIFEGAQGLLLDAENKRFFPHVTHSRTGLTNVMELSHRIGIRHLDVFYVVRSYLTRHGAGELPGEDANLSYEDKTNVSNEWQHDLRFAPMNYELVNEAILNDLEMNDHMDIDILPRMAVTHVDQHGFDRKKFVIPTKYESCGPTYENVWEVLNNGESRRAA